MKSYLAGIILIAMTWHCHAGWEEDWTIDQALGLGDRPWRGLHARLRSGDKVDTLMQAGLPPYDQQVERAQEIPEPVEVEVVEPVKKETTPSPAPELDPAQPPNPNPRQDPSVGPAGP
ncbi:MAG: hypothetical protein JXR37_00525 [Kiritimatiellae bacterium]|nr:hypothetical protein [Kiritimatiellia bacterium]